MLMFGLSKAAGKSPGSAKTSADSGGGLLETTECEEGLFYSGVDGWGLELSLKTKPSCLFEHKGNDRGSFPQQRKLYQHKLYLLWAALSSQSGLKTVQGVIFRRNLCLGWVGSLLKEDSNIQKLFLLQASPKHNHEGLSHPFFLSLSGQSLEF